jgi:hypothetical protein
MQLYKTHHFPGDAANRVSVSWQASLTEASKKRAELKRQGYKPETQTINIPTAKGPLLDWLNENVTN